MSDKLVFPIASESPKLLGKENVDVWILPRNLRFFKETSCSRFLR